MQKMEWFGAVRSHSGSAAMSSFDRAHTTSYSTLIETMRLSCTVFEVQPLIFRKSPILIHHTCIWRPRRGSPRSNFAEIFGVRNLESLQTIVWCCLCDPAFSRFSRTPTCDRQTDTGPYGQYRGCIASRGKKLSAEPVDRSVAADHRIRPQHSRNNNNNTEFAAGKNTGPRIKAKFHYTGPTGPARTRTDFVGDRHGPNGVSRRPGTQKKSVWVRSGPVRPEQWNLGCLRQSARTSSGRVGSGRVRVVEFSYQRPNFASRESAVKCVLRRRRISCIFYRPSPADLVCVIYFLPRDAMHPRYQPWACVCVCLSVRPSVTSRCSTKTAKRRITQTTPYDTPLWTQKISPQQVVGIQVICTTRPSSVCL